KTRGSSSLTFVSLGTPSIVLVVFEKGFRLGHFQSRPFSESPSPLGFSAGEEPFRWMSGQYPFIVLRLADHEHPSDWRFGCGCDDKKLCVLLRSTLQCFSYNHQSQISAISIKNSNGVSKVRKSAW